MFRYLENETLLGENIMSKGISQYSDEEKAEVRARRIKMNGKNPGLGTLAALDFQNRKKDKKAKAD